MKTASTALVIFAGTMLVTLIGASIGPSEPVAPREKTRDEVMWEHVDQLKEAVLATAHNPDSVKFDREYYSSTEDISCVQFRGSNMFGGIVRGVAVADNGNVSFDRHTFERKCK